MEIPLFPLHTVLCPGIVLPLHIFEDRYRALTRHCLDTGDAVRGRPDPRRSRGRRGQRRWRWPASARWSRSARPAATRTVATTCWPRRPGDSRSRRSTPAREPYLVADVTPLDDEVGDEARAERLAASAIRRFVRYLELMRARDGETTEVLDIRVEVESVGADDTDVDETSIDRRRPADVDPTAARSATTTSAARRGRDESTPTTKRRRASPRPGHPRRPDGPVVPAVGHRPDRTAAPPGAARGGDDGRAARGAGRAARPRARCCWPGACGCSPPTRGSMRGPRRS